MPTKRTVLVHANFGLMLWAVSITLVVFGVKIDTVQDETFTRGDIVGLVVFVLILAAWIAGSVALYRWSRRPPSRRSRIVRGRQDLTARERGWDPAPSSRRAVPGILTDGGSATRFFPRYVGNGIDVGNLTRSRPQAGRWHYVAVQVDAELPQLVLESTKIRGLTRDIGVDLRRRERLSLEGDFDRSFHAFVPAGHETDALYLLTPDVMATLIDHASRFHIEISGGWIVFFAPDAADFGHAETWHAIDEILAEVVPRIAPSAARFRSDRTGGALALRDRRRGGWWALVAIGWALALFVFYAVPACFGFAGLMSFIDGP